MPIASSDIKNYKSTLTDSDGGAIDLARPFISGVDNNIFPDITAAEALTGGTRYRKYFKRNEHSTDAWSDVRSYIRQQPANAVVSIGVGIDHADDREGDQGNMTAFTATAAVAVVSDGADARQVTILGEDASGNRQTSNLTLNGTTEVNSGATTYSKVYHVFAASEDASRTITVRQGAGGTTRGTIGANRKICFLWRTGTDIDSMTEGYKRGNIAASGNFAVWIRKVWSAGVTAGSGFTPIISHEGA
jgi:hypothetical protein